jgi:hypothetical protein
LELSLPEVVLLALQLGNELIANVRPRLVPPVNPVDHGSVDLRDLQRQRLRATVEWARKIRTTLQRVLDNHGDRVHFRPCSTGVAMVGLLPDRPQRGKSGITNLRRVVTDFESMFASHCRDIEHGRATGEKALQSHLISEAQKNGRHLIPINAASQGTDDTVELILVTDEIPLPVEGGKIVCDILALRRDRGRSTPVLLELKDARMLTRLVEQVECYAALMDEHAELFAALFEALLGEPVTFDGPAEKWIVWPAARASADPREEELRARSIRVVEYEKEGDGFRFKVSGAEAAERSDPCERALGPVQTPPENRRR